MTDRAPDRFDRALVARLRDAVEIELETEDERGSGHAATIWVVVDDHDRVLVRSWRGGSARWFREATSGRPVAILSGGERIPVSVEAADDERIDACSRALERKYRGDPATASMIRPEILGTTLELRPRA